ncbi:MAG: hypothetical protein OXM57_05155 [bacterium]|nr:hypothetical protein [bacterium]
MTRGLRRRRERATRKGRLCTEDAQTLDKMRRLPNFPATFDDTEFPIWTEPEQVEPILALIRRNQDVQSLEQRLRNHPGKESRISVEALFLAAVLAAKILGSYRRTDLCAVLNGFPSQVAYQLGLWDMDNPPPVSYHSVCDQIQRLEEVLGAKWTEKLEAIFDLDWICHTFVNVAVPRRVRKMISAVSIDSKVIESWAVSKNFKKEEDALAEHELAAREEADLAEPTLPEVTGPFTYEIDTPGPDGRVIRGHDRDARLTYKSATTREKAKIVLGYDLHFVTAVPGANWRGDPRDLGLNKAPPKFILAMAVVPGATNPGLVALDLVARAMEIAPRIKEVIADRAYTNKRKTFCRKLHEQGIDVVMEYNSGEIDRPVPVTVGRNNKQQLMRHLGSFFSAWLPEELLVPPAKLTGKKLEEWYANRARWRWTVNRYLKGGAVQLICPQCAGRVKTSAKTRNPKKTPAKGPVLAIDDEYCCEGLVTVPVDKLDSYQRIPPNTRAWRKSYKDRRNNSETKNSTVGDKGNFAIGWCRVFNKVAITLGALAKVIAHNLSIAARHRRDRTQHEEPITDTEPSDTPPSEAPSTPAETPRGPP